MKTRMTVQKMKILEHLRSVKNHPSAEQVYEKVKKEIPTITLATVYRNLNLLAEQGEILRMKVGNEYHYDGDTKCHQHCICEKCGKIMDSCKPEINEYAMKKIKSKEFLPSSLSIMVFGLCKKCRGGV